MAPRGWTILPKAADRGPLHPGDRPPAAPGRRGIGPAAAARRRTGLCRQRPVIGPRHFFRARAVAAVRTGRLDAAQRHPVSLAQPRLWQLRRLPLSAVLGQAQGDPQGARLGPGGGRDPGAARKRNRRGGVGCVLGVLPGYRIAQMGPALPDPRGLQPVRGADGRPGRADPRLSGRTGDRRGTQLHRAGRALRPLLGGSDREAVPALRAVLLSGDRTGDRAGPAQGRGRGAGAAQAGPRL